MTRARLIGTVLGALALGIVSVSAAVADGEPAGGGTPLYEPGEVIVRYEGGPERVIEIPDSAGVNAVAAELARNPRVAYALPNYIARASAIPNDPGSAVVAGGWQERQWNFLPCGSLCGSGSTALEHQARGGIDAPGAWAVLRQRGRPYGKGVKVAVLDTGVAYLTRRPKFKRSPDFGRKQFLAGHDFVDNDRVALDQDGHGTHVAGTIAERTNNARFLTGLAPGAKLIPVRVLDSNGFGNARDIAKGIRFAAGHGAQVINLSFEFRASINSCAKIKGVCKAIRFAARSGAVIVAAAGNSNGDRVLFPSAAPRVVSVGRTTKDACVADASRGGLGLDLVAPGGGAPRSPGSCDDDGTPFAFNAPVFQLTFSGAGFRRFGYPGFYEGTSMSAAHVSGVAALVIASGVLGARPSPQAVECQLEATARDDELGEAYDRNRFGAGLLDAKDAVTTRAPGC